jgi:hypothetical protein
MSIDDRNMVLHCAPRADYCKLVFGPHAGPVVALCVSPFLPELLLSVGDWTFRLWHHGIDSQVALYVSPQAEEMYTAGAWVGGCRG